MSRLTWVCFALALVAACESFSPVPPARVAAISEHAFDDRTVVALVNSQDSALLLETKARRRGYELQRKERLSGLDYFMLAFTIPTGLDATVAGEELEAMEPHATADKNHYYSLQSERAGGHAGLGDRQARRQTNSPGQCGAALSVGMIDSRVATQAPGVKDTSIIIREFLPGSSAETAVDMNSHGTAIAELLSRRRAKSAAPIYAAAVVDERTAQLSSAAALIRALDWMATMDVDVINISLAGPYNKSLDRALQRISDRGSIVVAAVGNNGPASPPLYPAALEDVIAVTAIDAAGDIYRSAVRGDHVDFAAIGVEEYLIGAGAGRFVSGTSFAAPKVTMTIAAHEWAARPESTAFVRRALAANARDLGERGRDSIFGYGDLSSAERCL